MDTTIPNIAVYPKDHISKNGYYLAVSAIQKCIRRGDAERAVNLAKVAWRCNSYRLFARLWTILFEDCGRDIDSLLAFYRHRSGYATFEPLIPLIRSMAQGYHSRDVCGASSLIKDGGINYERLEATLKGTVHEPFLELCRDRLEAIHDYSVWDFGSGDANYDWTIELAERGMKFDWEKFSVGLPYFFQSRMMEPPADIPVKECGPLTLYRDFYPLEALDDHTRPGKIAFATYIKHRSDPYMGARDIGSYMFFQEGWLCSKLITHSFNFGFIADTLAGYTAYQRPEIVEHFRTVVNPEMAKVRKWVLDKQCSQEMDQLKAAYLEDFFPIPTL